jgi:hypothetical protein
MILPMFTIYALTNEHSIFFFLTGFVFSLECILLKLLPNIKIMKIKNSKYALLILLTAITVFVYFSMLKANGKPSLKALDLTKVYEVRNRAVYPFLMSYLVNWQAKVINPFLITTSYIHKNKKLFLLSIFLQVLLYLMTAHKSYLLIPVAILFVVKIMKWDFLKISSLSAFLGSAGLLIIYGAFNSITLPSLFLRRLLFIPAQLKFYYYDFFSKNDLLYFSQGAIGKIFGLKYPYDMSSAHMIGEIYYNNPQTAANTGYIADAYANMGIPGMIIITILFVFILVLIDSLGSKIGKELTVGLAIFPIMTLNDGALLTTLLTGGLLFLLVILYLYSSNQSVEVIENKN